MITNKFGAEDDYDRGLHVISCLTCKMTQKYYSELGGANFRLSHMGHVVRESPLPHEAQVPQVIPEQETTVAEAPQADKKLTVAQEPAKAEETPAAEELAEAHPAAKRAAEEPTKADTVFNPVGDFPVLLSKLQVDIAIREEDKKPSFIVWGLRNGKMDAFILFFPLENPSGLKNLLEKRQYVKQDHGDKILFTWARGVVEISDEAKAKLHPPVPEVTLPQKMPEVRAKPRVEEEPPRVKLQVEEELIEEKSKVEEKPREVLQPPQVARVQATPPVVAERVVEKVDEKPVTVAPAYPAPKKEKEVEKEDPLLLARSSYLQEGEENRREAARVSKVLRAFRWNVEPAYMIGVILDDNISIETNTGVISRALIRRIESLGYGLIAVNVSRERPIAWFKRKAVQSHPTVSDSSRLREVERKLAEQTSLLDEERRRFDDERAGWQQRFTLLSKLMATMGEPLPAEEGSVDSSEPEPDLTS